MEHTPDTKHEQLRLQALQLARLLDTPPEADFDDLTRLTATICQTPTVLISLVDEQRQWFKSRFGLDVCETPRSQAFCAYTIQNPSDVFIVENTLEDARFIHNPLVAGAPHIRFYAGAPIVDSGGYALGSLCVIDYVPRHLEKTQIEALRILARQVSGQIELRRTSRQNAETSLRYRQILEQAADGIYIYDLEGQIKGANRKFCEITGRSETELLQMRMQDLFAETDLENLAIRLVELRTGKHLINEYCIIRPDKTIVPVELSEKIIDKNTLQGIVRDITERKQSESELSESRQLFSLFMNNSPTMIYMKDSAGRFVFANEMLERAFDVKAIDLIGKTNECVVPDDIAERVNRSDKDLLETGQAAQMIEVVPMADGTSRHWLSHKFLIQNKAGEKFIGGIGVDITERHEMELELKATRDAALESANLKSAFLANISHEIRTPMNGVIGMTDLLSNTSLDNTQHEYVNTIRQSSEALLTVINDILDLSKIEAGKMRFNSIEFDVREVVESTVQMFAERAQRKNLEIASLIDSEVPQSLRGDPGRLRQVLTNLIGNAIKFTETGEIGIKVIVSGNFEDKMTLLFSVADTGIGISAENLKLLFRPFMQVDNSNTRQFGGTGLGLAISKQIVEMMNGEISGESQPEKGSIFKFNAQFQQSLLANEVIQPNTLSIEKENQLKDKRILIAENGEVSRQTLSSYASSWNMQTAEAASGTECLNQLRAAQVAGKAFDFVLIDIGLLDHDGFALAKMIKSDPNLHAVEIIFTASHGQRGDADEAQRLGVAGYLAKPLRGTQLFDCLTTLLERRATKTDTSIITRHTLRETKSRYNALSSVAETNELSVLVVEDNEVNRRIVLAQLKRAGIIADFAVDGAEALEKIADKSCQLILMDCQMPRLDGYQATAEIRRLENIRREQGKSFVPLIIIALTAHTLDGEREKCLAVGMNDYLSKPFKSEDLIAMIGQWQNVISGASNSSINPNSSVLADSTGLSDHTVNIEN